MKLIKKLLGLNKEKEVKSEPKTYRLERLVKGINIKTNKDFKGGKGIFINPPEVGKNFQLFKDGMTIDNCEMLTTGMVTRVVGDKESYIFNTTSGSKYKLTPVED
jgi:hypothetical protein